MGELSTHEVMAEVLIKLRRAMVELRWRDARIEALEEALAGLILVEVNPCNSEAWQLRENAKRALAGEEEDAAPAPTRPDSSLFHNGLRSLPEPDDMGGSCR